MELKFAKKGFDLDMLSNCIGYRLIFGLSAGPRDDSLLLGAPRYKIATEKDMISPYRTAIERRMMDSIWRYF